jgi:hypothetical protein
VLTWVDWLKLAAVFLAAGTIGMLAVAAMFWLFSRPIRRGPERIVDVRNRGHTRIRMPDGTIK